MGCNALASTDCISLNFCHTSQPFFYLMQSSTIISQYTPAHLNTHLIFWVNVIEPP
jgi:hypothetical protein